MNYYNENDPRAAAWLRELIQGGQIPAGDVDERSITDVGANELHGYTQCHFFAGIGGWSLALKLAGWPDSRPVWTGSCPCQPFSTAGKKLGRNDSRHLWPAWRRLINRAKPPIVFGEQVASKDGRAWLAGVFANLEAMGYAPAGADLCAAGAGEEAEGWVCRGDTVTAEPVIVGAPHIRQRLFWVAYADCDRCDQGRRGKSEAGNDGAFGDGRTDGLSNTENDNGRRELEAQGAGSGRRGFAGDLQARGLGNADSAGFGEQRGAVAVSTEQPAAELRSDLGAWSDFDLLGFRDGKTRRVESGSFPLAHGVPERVGLLRGYGNAIVPQIAAEFIQAAEEARGLI